MNRLYIFAWVLAIVSGMVFAAYWATGGLRVAGIALALSMVGVLFIGYAHSAVRAGRS